MNRRNFFKNLTVAAAGVIVAPAVVAEAVKNTPKPKRAGYMNVDWKKVASPPWSVITVGDSTGGKSPGAFIVINISGKHCDCPQVGFNLYYNSKDGMVHPLCITEVALRSGYNSTARLVLRPFSRDLMIGSGAIKDGTVMMVGGSYFGNTWKLDAVQKYPYNNKPFDSSDFDRITT